MANKWKMLIHGTDYTRESIHESEIDAEAEAYLVLGRGIRFGTDIYPNTTIVKIELKEIEDGK